MVATRSKGSAVQQQTDPEQILRDARKKRKATAEPAGQPAVKKTKSTTAKKPKKGRGRRKGATGKRPVEEAATPIASPITPPPAGPVEEDVIPTEVPEPAITIQDEPQPAVSARSASPGFDSLFDEPPEEADSGRPVPAVPASHLALPPIPRPIGDSTLLGNEIIAALERSATPSPPTPRADDVVQSVEEAPILPPSSPPLSSVPSSPAAPAARSPSRSQSLPPVVPPAVLARLPEHPDLAPLSLVLTDVERQNARDTFERRLQYWTDRRSRDQVSEIEDAVEERTDLYDHQVLRAIGTVAEAIRVRGGPERALIADISLARLHADEQRLSEGEASPGGLEDDFYGRGLEWFLPINFRGVHWFLAHVRLNSSGQVEVDAYDSLPGGKKIREDRAETIRHYIRNSGWFGQDELSDDGIEITWLDNTRQNSNWECGRFTILNAWALMLGMTPIKKGRQNLPGWRQIQTVFNLAMQGYMDGATIEALLLTFSYASGPVTESVTFDQTLGFPDVWGESSLRNHLLARRQENRRVTAQTIRNQAASQRRLDPRSATPEETNQATLDFLARVDQQAEALERELRDATPANASTAMGPPQTPEPRTGLLDVPSPHGLATTPTGTRDLLMVCAYALGLSQEQVVERYDRHELLQIFRRYRAGMPALLESMPAAARSSFTAQSTTVTPQSASVLVKSAPATAEPQNRQASPYPAPVYEGDWDPAVDPPPSEHSDTELMSPTEVEARKKRKAASQTGGAANVEAQQEPQPEITQTEVQEPNNVEEQSEVQDQSEIQEQSAAEEQTQVSESSPIQEQATVEEQSEIPDLPDYEDEDESVWNESSLIQDPSMIQPVDESKIPSLQDQSDIGFGPWPPKKQ